MRHMHLQASTIATVMVGVALTGCGAKSGLTVPEVRFDGGWDAAIPLDAPPRDTPRDAFVPPPDECVELPPREPPEFIDVTFISRVSTADVYFLVDVTGSMGDEIEQIRASLRDVLIPGIAAEIDNVRFAVGYYADFPAGEYGAPTDEVFRLLAPSTDSASLVQDAVNRLALQSGGDGPESTTEALYLSAAGSALGRYVPSRRCPDPSTVGYPCFRNDGSRIFLVFTDAPFHNGPFGANPYDSRALGVTAHTYNETITALRSIGGKVLGLYSGGGDPEGLSHLQALARDTGAVRPDGSPIVFDIGLDGRALGASVVEAIRTLVDEVPIDIDVLIEDEPSDELDARMFVDHVEALRAVPESGASRLPDRFDDVLPGTEVTFRVFLANERIERGAEPLRYRLQVVLRGDGVTRLKTTIVEVVIPSIDGVGCEVL